MANNPKIQKGKQPEWLKGKDFRSNPQNRNTKGANKSFKSIVSRLSKEDFQALDKKSLMQVYKIMFNTPEKELKSIYNDKDTPWGFKIIYDTLKDEKTRFAAFKEYQQWLYGKAPEAGEVVKHNTDIRLEDYTAEEQALMKKIDANLEDEY